MFQGYSFDAGRGGWLNGERTHSVNPSMVMNDISREHLHAYLDDALSDAETARVEQALRESESLRRALHQAMQERDRGEHSLGAVWRRERLTCPTREQLGSYLLQVLDEGEQDYLNFHLHTIGCPYCVANLADLQALQKEPAPRTRERRRRFFQSSAGYLQICRDTKNDETPRR
jgi:DNA-binding phage protein